MSRNAGAPLVIRWSRWDPPQRGPQLHGDCTGSPQGQGLAEAFMGEEHLPMPTFRLYPDEQAHVIAYLESL